MASLALIPYFFTEPFESFSVLDNQDRPLQGSGQGTGQSAGLLVLVADISNDALATNSHPAAILHSVNREEDPVTQQTSVFMDDTTLYMNLAGITSYLMTKYNFPFDKAVVYALEHLVKTYSKYLWTTGGRLSLEKCYWYLLISVRGKNGLYKFLPAQKCKHDMTLQEEAIDGALVTIPQLDPSDVRRGLGITGAPDGKWKTQRTVLLDKARHWATSIRASALNAAEIWTAYTSVLWPGLSYSLAITSLSVLDLRLIQQKVSLIIGNSLGLNKSFPDALFYGAKKYGGLGIVPLIAQQCILKLFLFLRHIRSNDDIRRQLLISMSYTQLEVGVATQFFRIKFSKFTHLLTSTWTTHLWEFLSLSNIQLWHASSEPIWLPVLQREHDTFISTHILASSFSLEDQRIINEWRIYFRAISIADLATTNGKYISKDVFFGWKTSERRSNLHWPVASRPS